MKLLDLCCGAGGAAMGYRRAGFSTIVGVDIEPMPDYPFEFIQGDALEIDFSSFDMVHASPPCQRFSGASGLSDRTHHPDVLRPLRKKLVASGLPYVIENVEGAPLYNPLKLCGTIFPELRVLRHRLFESNIPIPQPYLEDKCSNHPFVWRYGDERDEFSTYVTVAGGGHCSLEAAKDAMGIDWMKQRDLSQAIPPAYTEYIGKFAKTYLS